MNHLGVSLNKNSIRKIESSKLEKNKVLELIDIDEKLLAEKDNWYMINDTLCFFKERNDDRLFGEFLSKEVFSIYQIPTAQYEIVVLNNKIGILTESFQDKSKYNYYDLNNFYELFSWAKINHNDLTFKKILEIFSYQELPNIQEIIQELIDRYVGEWLTHQTDGNIRNLMFKQNKVTGEISLAPSFDREKSFGINSNDLFDYGVFSEIWIPAIPYEDSSFRDSPYKFDDVDANIFPLYMDFPEETKAAFLKYAELDYEAIFKNCNRKYSQFTMSQDFIDYLCELIDMKKNEMHRMIRMREKEYVL